MINAIFINGQALYGGKKPHELPELNDEMFSIGVCFDSKDELFTFCSNFPKSMKITPPFMYSLDGAHIPYVECRKMQKNKITGEMNETGDLKLIRFYKALKSTLK